MMARHALAALALASSPALAQQHDHAGIDHGAMDHGAMEEPAQPDEATADPHAGMDMPETEPASDGHDHQH